MRLLHAGLPDAGGRRAGARAGHQRRRPARRAVVQSLPLHRLPEHHQGGARRGRRDARTARDTQVRARWHMPDASKFVGRSVPRLEDRPLLTGPGPLCRRCSLCPASCTCASCARPSRTASCASIDAERGAARMPGVHAVWTAADVADIPPIDFRLTARSQGLDAYRQRVLATRPRALCRRAGGGGVRRRSLSRRGCRRSGRARDRGTAGVLRAEQRPGEFEPGRSTEPAIVRKEYGDLDAAFRNAHAIVALELVDRPPFRRAAGDPRRDRAL